ncbi:MAG: hypothetical protein CR982_00615 [Candidatus Cloacimonadota bacterium]|nr:MAG: hypothetical protein CR982_00615 [Candidatus Cloacimonadota bacterium]PIE78433.1 MAG: hypothetical protein CSA15_07790 [Candidatus Delongbacteria bacterium]
MGSTGKGLRLLPNYFSKVGLILLFCSISIPFLWFLEILDGNKELVKIITTDGLLISFLFIAVAKSKKENELSIRVRLQAFAVAFISIVVLIIIDSFFMILENKETFTRYGVARVLISMFVFYFCFFFYLMWKVKKRVENSELEKLEEGGHHEVQK